MTRVKHIPSIISTIYIIHVSRTLVQEHSRKNPITHRDVTYARCAGGAVDGGGALLAAALDHLAVDGDVSRVDLVQQHLQRLHELLFTVST